MKKNYRATGISFIVVLALLALCPWLTAADDTGRMTVVPKGTDCVQISEGGTLFAQYRTDYKGTPIVWPICSKDGLLMTRAYPMIEDENIEGQKDSELANILRNAKMAVVSEARDHPHQRSLWFTHGNVNDCDFWALAKDTEIVHEGFTKAEVQDGVAIVQAKNRWVDTKQNRILCRDLRTLVFGTVRAEGRSIRYIDFFVTITACQDEVRFNDTKEGTFGVRVPGTMDVNAKTRNKRVGLRCETWGGHIINSNGEVDDLAWSKRAAWVDYYGPTPARCNDAELDAFAKSGSPESLKLKTAGITIMQHPTAFRYPTWWHVRTYGLFAANPFGQKDFEKNNSKADGTLTLKKGEAFTCGYRVLFHDGVLSPKTLDALYAEFSAAKCPLKK